MGKGRVGDGGLVLPNLSFACAVRNKACYALFSARERVYIYIYIYMCVCIYIYIYVCVCVCVCVCVRASVCM